MICPSLRAQSSAKKLVVIPIFLEKALIQAPESEQSTPSPPAAPGFPSDESSVLSLNQPLTGLFLSEEFCTKG